ncbi:MAG: depupylase/deamidase Dop [Actinomycetaceae bacterium]|nr:depupylase/deamidase Dop [Actinomycetaceae bacterium]
MRIFGTETEYGIIDESNPGANPIALSAQLVQKYAASLRPEPVRWDYVSEDPLNDLRGIRFERGSVHPSQLTDNPHQMAPSGENIAALPISVPATVLPNGARFYVDHAHPEYSSPETASVLQAVLQDKAGEVLGRRVLKVATECGQKLALFKNNVDGKGASYGAHENYLVRRDLPFTDLTALMVPFLVTRPVVCGAGRVGIGQASSRAGFQISQRADYIENDIGLETTFNRPLVNTRDEPHANPQKWRRLHIICGDANMLDYSTYLRMGTTALLLEYLESGGGGMEATALEIDGDPVAYVSAVSHDPHFNVTISTRSGMNVSAAEHQLLFAEIIGDALTQRGLLVGAHARVHDLWVQVLQSLQTDRDLAARRVEWVAKYRLFEAMRQRKNTTWDDPVLAAMDLQWSKLQSPLFVKLSGHVDQLFSEDEAAAALDFPPADTRALFRGLATRFNQVKAASWTSLVVAQGGELRRYYLPEVGEVPEMVADEPNMDLEAFISAL